MLIRFHDAEIKKNKKCINIDFRWAAHPTVGDRGIRIAKHVCATKLPHATLVPARV